jgi:hypothetical protein
LIAPLISGGEGHRRFWAVAVSSKFCITEIHPPKTTNSD